MYFVTLFNVPTFISSYSSSRSTTGRPPRQSASQKDARGDRPRAAAKFIAMFRAVDGWGCVARYGIQQCNVCCLFANPAGKWRFNGICHLLMLVFGQLKKIEEFTYRARPTPHAHVVSRFSREWGAGPCNSPALSFVVAGRVPAGDKAAVVFCSRRWQN